ncbi:MAG: hypothetical protein ACE5H8_07250 [Alphaproteobacteria bacterium]
MSPDGAAQTVAHGASAGYGAASNDPFIRQFFARTPANARTSFTDRQLAVLKSVFGDATHTGHLVDIRLSLPLPRRRTYLVLLMGRDRRQARRTVHRRRRGPLARLAQILVGGLFAIQLLITLAAFVWFLL